MNDEKSDFLLVLVLVLGFVCSVAILLSSSWFMVSREMRSMSTV